MSGRVAAWGRVEAWDRGGAALRVGAGESAAAAGAWRSLAARVMRQDTTQLQDAKAQAARGVAWRLKRGVVASYSPDFGHAHRRPCPLLPCRHPPGRLARAERQPPRGGAQDRGDDPRRLDPRDLEQEASDGQELAALAVRHPRVHFILAHIGGGGDWEHSLAALRATPNVFVDLSGSGVDGGMLEACLEAAGVERLLWGTDLTMDTAWAKLRYLERLLPPRDLELVQWRNAARIFPRGAFPAD